MRFLINRALANLRAFNRLSHETGEFSCDRSMALGCLRQILRFQPNSRTGRHVGALTAPNAATKVTKTRKHETRKTGKGRTTNAQDSTSSAGRCRTIDARHHWLLHRRTSGARAGTAGNNLLASALSRVSGGRYQLRAREAVPGVALLAEGMRRKVL